MAKKNSPQSTQQAFTGFTPKAFTFLKKLKKNNNREWFQLHKEEYLTQVQLPMQLLIQELAQSSAPVMKTVFFNPKKNILRVYRDTRFSADKTPHKTYIAAQFKTSPIKRQEPMSGWYLHIEPGGEVFMGAGLYMPSSNQMRKVRQLIMDKPDDFLKVMKAPAFKKRFPSLYGEKMKTKPKGVSADHPMIEYMRYKHWFVLKYYSEKDVMSRKFIRLLTEDFAASWPLVQWLEKAEQLW